MKVDKGNFMECLIIFLSLLSTQEKESQIIAAVTIAVETINNKH